MLTHITAKLIKRLLPAEHWYRAAFLFAKGYARVSRAPSGSWIRKRYEDSFRLNHAQKLEALLAAFGADGPVAFPMPVRVAGDELQHFKKVGTNGLLLCTVHTPLNLAGVRYLLEIGVTIDGIVARYPPPDGNFTITGTTVKVPALPVNRHILLKVKSILKRGGLVITLVDHLADGRFSHNQFYLAEKLKAELLVVLVELQPDATILNKLIAAHDFQAGDEHMPDDKISSINQKVLDYLNQ